MKNGYRISLKLLNRFGLNNINEIKTFSIVIRKLPVFKVIRCYLPLIEVVCLRNVIMLNRNYSLLYDYVRHNFCTF